MKQTTTLLLAFAALWWAGVARAQDYRPFRFGLSYQLNASASAGDTTHLLRLASRQQQGADSLFLFNKRSSRGRPAPNSAGCGFYVMRADNLFGATLLVRPGAEYVLTAAGGRTFTLRPRAPLGQLWTAAAPSPTARVTAQVTARTLGTVLGQPDSLATITLSDGAVVVLGKRFGWVSGPPLGRYLGVRVPPGTLALSALPELRLGVDRLGAFATYDFQPGDVFLRRTTSFYLFSPGGAQCFDREWARDSIISRTLSANGDTLRYQQRHQVLTRSCAGRAVLAAPVVQTLRIVRPSQNLDQPTNFLEPLGPATSTAGRLHLPAWRTGKYNNRPVQTHLDHLHCATTPDSVSLRDAVELDFGYYLWTAPGLGLTREEHRNYFSADTTVLLGYRKGAEVWGELTPFTHLLPARASRPAATTTAFPNPFGAGLTVAFSLGRSQAVGLVLRDALGRVALARAAELLPAGDRQLTLATAGLPAGVYSLHLRFTGESRTEVLRVLKTE